MTLNNQPPANPDPDQQSRDEVGRMLLAWLEVVKRDFAGNNPESKACEFWIAKIKDQVQ